MASLCSTSRSAVLSAPAAPRRRLVVRALFQPQTPTPLTPQEAAARVPPPKGVTLPPRIPTKEPLTFGFVDYAERINGRTCMLGFFGTLLVELILQRGVLEAAGFRVGNGLGFEF